MATPTPEQARNRLPEAKRAAQAAEDQQRDLERKVAAARRKTQSLWRRYDDLVLIAEGQQTLDI